MNLCALYVLISRCRTLGSLRLLKKDEYELNRIQNLLHDEYLAAWVDGYDRGGCWNDELAVRALARIRQVRREDAELRHEEKLFATRQEAAEKKATRAAEKEATRAARRERKQEQEEVDVCSDVERPNEQRMDVCVACIEDDEDEGTAYSGSESETEYDEWQEDSGDEREFDDQGESDAESDCESEC